VSDISEILADEAEQAEAVAEAEERGNVSFTVKRHILLTLCERAVPVISSSDALPVLRNFLIQVSPGSLTLTGSDVELSVQASSPAVATSDTATLAIPAKKLLAMLREAPEDSSISVESTGAKATVSAGTPEQPPVVSWDLRLGDHRDYTELPDLVDVKTAEVDRVAFLAALKAVKHAIGRDGGRPPLMMVDISDSKVTASDGVRFQRAFMPGFPADMKIPAAAVDHLLRMMGNADTEQISVADHENYLVFKVGSTVFLTHKLMARFPDMERLILKPALTNADLLRVDRGQLLEAVRRVRITANADTSAIGLRLSRDKLTILSRDETGNAAEQALEVWWKGSDRLVVLNHVFLTDMLNSWPHAVCKFWLGPDTGRRKSLVMLSDKETTSGQEHEATQIGIINQLHAALLGYT
jgi:DNA polymerase-3 subunit beta